jgi:hypothetical protein
VLRSIYPFKMLFVADANQSDLFRACSALALRVREISKKLFGSTCSALLLSNEMGEHKTCSEW